MKSVKKYYHNSCCKGFLLLLLFYCFTAPVGNVNAQDINKLGSAYLQLPTMDNTPTSDIGSELAGGSWYDRHVYQINAGGPAVPPYLTDQYFSGGHVATINNAVDISMVTEPAPQAVYQSERWGAMTYTIPGLAAGATYYVRLHMSEFTDPHPGQREFNVLINGTQVLNNLDIYAQTGALYKELTRSFSTKANSSGQIVIDFKVGAADMPVCSAIDIDY